MLASVKGHHKTVTELLNHHADVNTQDEKGFTPLSNASIYGHHETVKELLNHLADVNAQNKDGSTALMFAIYYKHYEILKELLNHHADANIQTKGGFTALMIAAIKENNQAVMELCNHNADLNLQDSDGNTALHLVLQNEKTDTTINIVEMLLSDSTNLEKLNKENKSVIQLARESQIQDIVELIEDFSQQRKIKAARRELKKLQAYQIICKKKKKLHQIKTLKDEERDLTLKIHQVERKNAELEEQIKKNCEQMKIWQGTLNSTRENEDFRSYEKLKEEIKYLERCMETETFDDVVQLAKRECPICFNEMRVNKKIYQCQSGHIFCEECFARIKEGTKICSFCRVDIVSNPIRCRALEEVIEEEANG